MSGVILGLAVVALLVAVIFKGLHSEQKSLDGATLSPSELQDNLKKAREKRAEYLRAYRDGPLNAVLICPHCQAKGTVRTKAVKKKAGISGGKAAAAVLTGGLSVVAVGLSRKEGVTQAHCENCGSTWHF
jgi:transcription elongation factor Elf1